MISVFAKQIRAFKKFLTNSHPGLILFLVLVVGIVFTVVSALVFLKLSRELFEQEMLSADLVIVHFVYFFRSPTLTTIMMIITNLGGTYLPFIGTALMAGLLIKKHYRETVLFLFILSMGLLLNLSLKAIVQRDRPDMSPLVVEQDYSFPSGHAMNSFVFYSTISYLVYHFTKNKMLATGSFFMSGILILLIGFSRVYLGVHYPSDILAGYAAGLVWFCSVFVIQKTLVFYRLFKESYR